MDKQDGRDTDLKIIIPDILFIHADLTTEVTRWGNGISRTARRG